MSQSTTLMPDAQASSTIAWSNLQARTPDGKRIWNWIAWAFAAYWIMFVAGAFMNRRELNSVGAVFILAVLGWAAMERLWVRVDAVVIASVAAAVIPLLHMALSNTAHSGEAIIKHVSLCVVLALSRMLRLPAAFSSRVRWVLALQVLIVLVVCLTVDRGADWDGGTRRAGLFANPNNLALIPFLLLFLVNESQDPILIRIAAHAIVTSVLVFSATSGAVVAYAIGLAVHLRAALARKWRLLAYALLIVGGLVAATLLTVGLQKLEQTRVGRQLYVISTELQNVAEGGQVAYYEQERVLGPGAASGIWRLVHWRRTLGTYADGTFAQQLFGFGLGSSPLILGKLPHNEYLRALFEQGIIGLILFLFVWFRVITTAPPSVRYVGLIVAIYSFSENNLDNFPFMSLLILCLSAAELIAADNSPLRATLSRRLQNHGIASGMWQVSR